MHVHRAFEWPSPCLKLTRMEDRRLRQELVAGVNPGVAVREISGASAAFHPWVKRSLPVALENVQRSVFDVPSKAPLLELSEHAICDHVRRTHTVRSD